MTKFSPSRNRRALSQSNFFLWVLSIGLLISVNTTVVLAGTLQTLSLEEIPVGLTMEIRAPDDSELSFVLTRGILTQLEDRGFVVAEAGDLVLRFSVDLDELSQPRAGDSRVTLSGEGGSQGLRSGELQLRLGTDKKKAKPGRRMKLRIAIGRPQRPPLWTGVAQEFLQGTDRLTLGKAMANALVSKTGETYQNRPEKFINP